MVHALGRGRTTGQSVQTGDRLVMSTRTREVGVNATAFAIFFAIFYTIISKVPHTDISIHIAFVVRINHGQMEYPAEFLFDFLTNLGSLFTSKTELMRISAATILAAASTLKFWLVKKIIRQEVSTELSTRLVSTIATALIVGFSIPDFYSVFVLNKLYVSRFVPLVWHNPTIILAFPFAIWLFWRQAQLLEARTKPSVQEVLGIAALVGLNVISKPSFIFVYLPVTAVIVLVKFGIRSRQLVPLALGFILVGVQYVLIFRWNLGTFDWNLGTGTDVSSSVRLADPFHVLKHFIPAWYIPYALVISYAFPIATVLASRQIFRYFPFVYSAALTLVSLLISSFVIEAGARQFHGNFTWQNIICSFLLQLSCVIFIVRDRLSSRQISRQAFAVLTSIMALQFISGIAYLIKIFYSKSYL